MPQDRNPKETAYRRSQKFGNIHGGRKKAKWKRILQRLHELEAPGPEEERPILMVDNPSRDFYFPLSGEEVVGVLNQLPWRDTEGLTHVWLRRLNKKDFGDESLATFVIGSGVRLIMLHPWPVSRELVFDRKPSTFWKKAFEKYDVQVSKRGDKIVSKWNEAALKQFYIRELLIDRIGYHIDFYYRRWSPANRKQANSAALNYAFALSQYVQETYEGPEL